VLAPGLLVSLLSLEASLQTHWRLMFTTMSRLRVAKTRKIRARSLCGAEIGGSGQQDEVPTAEVFTK